MYGMCAVTQKIEKSCADWEWRKNVCLLRQTVDYIKIVLNYVGELKTIRNTLTLS